MTADFRVKVAVRNNCLLEAIEAAGYRAGGKFAKLAGIAYTELAKLVSMRGSPINENGEWRKVVTQLATFLDVPPEVLFREAHLERLQQPSIERRLHAEQVYLLIAQVQASDDPVALLEDKQKHEAIEDALQTLRPRERQVLVARFDGQSLEEIARVHELTRERVRQIEINALRKLRHPSHRALREAFNGERTREWDEPPLELPVEDDVEWTIHVPHETVSR